MADTVWLDVLPSLTNFAKELSSGATSAADSAGKQSGDSWSKAFSATASDGGAQKIVDGLKKASVDAEKAVSQETQAIAKARASQSDAAAKVVEAEAKLAAARKGDDAAKVEAAELRLQGARERLDGATSKVEQTEKSLAAASRNRKEVSEQLADAEGRLADSTKEASDQAEKSGSVFDRFKTYLFGTKDGSEQTEGALNKLGKAFSENAGKIALGVGGAALAAGKGLYEIGATFDDVSDTIRVGTGATGDALDGLVEVATNVGRTVPAQFSEIGPVVADLNTRLGLSGDTLQTVASQYLEAGRILGQDVDINQTSAAFSAFKIAGDDVIGGMDTLFRVSQATGVSMNDLASAVQDNAPAMQNLGFTFEETASLAGQLDKAGLESKTTLAAMGKGLVNLAKDGEEPQEAFRRVTGEIQDMIDAGDIAGAIDLSSGVFGTKAANQFVGAVQDGSLALDDLVANVQASDDTILGVGEETSDFAESWQLVKNNALAALEPLGSTVFNALGDALSEAVPYVTAFGDWVTEHPNLVTGLAIGVGVLAAALGVAAAAQWAMNFAMFASPITWILAGVVLVIGVFVALWTQVDGFRNFFLGAWDAIKTAAGAVADWFTGTLVPAFQGAWEGIKSAASAVADWFTGTLVPWFQGAGERISGVFTAMSEWVGARLQDIRDGGQRVADFFTVDIPAAFENAKNLVLEKLTALRDSGIAAFEGLRDGVGAAMDGIRSAAATPVNFVIDLVWNNGLRAMVQGVIDLFGLGWELPRVEPIALARGAIMGDGRQPILWNEVPGQREAYIPINQSARSRDLWVETGQLLGAIPMAEGGIWPVAGTVTSGYGNRVGPFLGAEHHDGIDIGAPMGTPVVAALPGVVVFAGWNGGYGNQVTLDHGGGLSTFYAHLASIAVSLGQMVELGQLLGGVGSTGLSTGPHLHFGASMNGGSIDPSGVVSGSVSGGGATSGGAGLLSIIGRLGEFLDVLGGVGDSQWAQVVGGSMRGALGQFGDWVRDKLFGWIGPGSNSSGSVVDMARAMAEGRGWTGAQWDAIDWIVQRESSWNPNAQNPMSTAYGLFQFLDCVPLDTEILTREGWKRYDEVRPGDETLGYNAETGRTEWTVIRHVVIKGPQRVVRIESSRWSARVTPGHRWWTTRKVPVPPTGDFSECPECGARGTKRGSFGDHRSLRVHRAKAHGVAARKPGTQKVGEFCRTDELTTAHDLVLAAPAEGGEGLPITDVEAELLGWLAGDGHIHGDIDGTLTVTIYQSKPQFVARLRKLLVGIPHTESSRHRNPSHLRAHSFYLHAGYARDLLRRSGWIDQGPEQFVLQCSASQRAAWLGGVIGAEGCATEPQMRLPQNDGPIAEAIVLAVYMAGFRPSRRRPRPGFSSVTMSRPGQHVGMLTVSDESVEPVWCVQTDLGTWTMRQGEQVSLTGNSTWATVGASKTSDPSAQIQAGLAYIAQRYGDPLNAQAFWQANGWYDNGGLLDPGMTVAINGTGKTEKVLTDEQWATMARLAASATTSQIDEDELARLIAEAVKSALAGSQPTTETIQVVMDSRVVAEAVRKHNRGTGR